jgi:hypothetical protein
MKQIIETINYMGLRKYLKTLLCLDSLSLFMFVIYLVIMWRLSVGAYVVNGAAFYIPLALLPLRAILHCRIGILPKGEGFPIVLIGVGVWVGLLAMLFTNIAVVLIAGTGAFYFVRGSSIENPKITHDWLS